MKHMLARLLLFGLVTVSVNAQDAKSITGYLLEQSCAKSMVRKAPAEAMARAAKHTRECAIDEHCAASGYGLVSAGKWIPFDAQGHAKAAEFLRHTKLEDHILVVVTGPINDGVFAVGSIRESRQPAPKAPKKSGT